MALTKGDDVFIIESRTLHEKLSIDVMEGLKTSVLESVVVETGDQVAVHRADTSEGASLRQVSVLFSAVQRIADREERFSKKDEIFKEALLTRGPVVVMDPEYRRM